MQLLIEKWALFLKGFGCCKIEEERRFIYRIRSVFLKVSDERERNGDWKQFRVIAEVVGESVSPISVYQSVRVHATAR